MKFRNLEANEIEVRIGNGNKAKTGFSLLLYKDARVDMKLLDEVITPLKWKREHQEIKGVLYCGVSIYSDDLKEWVTKWDAGSESKSDAKKGEASDSFKRACVCWGIGRELYTSPFIWLKGNIDDNRYEKYSVKEIGYNSEGEINRLIILDSKKKVVYSHGVNNRHEPRREQARSVDEFKTPQPELVTTVTVEQLDGLLDAAQGDFKLLGAACYKVGGAETPQQLLVDKYDEVFNAIEKYIKDNQLPPR